MTMVSSGPISLGGTATTGGLNQSINVELGYSGTAQISLNDAAVRTLLGKASGAISLNDAYGKANQFAFTISSNQTNANLRTLAVNAGWNQSSKVVATISGGVYISSNSTGTPALTVNGSFPGGVELINNGFIIGMGGNGGNGRSINNSTQSGGSNGAAGGTALSVSVAISINNGSGTIGGGGGGGGGGGAGYNLMDPMYGFYASLGGGGGGGGRSSAVANSAGGSGGTGTGYRSASGAGGNQGTVSSAGNGGAGGTTPDTASYAFGGAGGSGGSWGTSGSNGAAGQTSPGQPPFGGSGGAAVSGNSNITWLATGTRLGGIS